MFIDHLKICQRISQDMISVGFDSAIITASNKVEDLLNKTLDYVEKNLESFSR